MKYKCLVFDHDDTVVNSTATIHHPCFVKYLESRRPGMTCTLEDYFIKNFAPGFIEMCHEDYGMTDEEMVDETEFWRNYVKDHIPDAYEGIREIMERQRAEGGIIAVISHSMRENILRDYKANSLPIPDVAFGWEQPPERRKPNVWPLEEIMRIYSLQPKDILMIDDLKPGYDMALAAGTDFAGAGWAYDVKLIENFMRANCTNYFKTVSELAGFLE